MKIYKTKVNKLPGSEYSEIFPRASRIYKELKKKSKRRPYVRSAYFNRDKIFLDYFWEHLHQKVWRDRVRRLKFYSCSIDLIKYSKIEPYSHENINKSSEILHRFAGITQNNELFYVQIKEDKKSGKKFLLSMFPG